MSHQSIDNIIKLRGGNGGGGDSGCSADVLAMIEELYQRARAGTVLGLAVIEHQRDDTVAIQISAGNYHYVNSGAARLAHYLAGMQHI